MVNVIDIDISRQADLTVAVMTNDDHDVLAHYVAAHQALGVAQIIMFFDNPENSFIPVAQSLENVKCFVCDDEFWRNSSKKRRPDFVETRQAICFRSAYLMAETNWIAFCDGDEIIFSEDGLHNDISSIPDNIISVRAHTREAVWAIGDDDSKPFSARFARLAKRRRRSANETRFERLSNHGIVGHTSGKYLIRTGLKGIFPGIHVARKREPGQRLEKIRADWFGHRFGLLHYDALSYELWRRKHERRASGTTLMAGNRKNRNQQTEEFAILDNEDDRRAMFDELYKVNAADVDSLMNEGILRRINISDEVLATRDALLWDPALNFEAR